MMESKSKAQVLLEKKGNKKQIKPTHKYSFIILFFLLHRLTKIILRSLSIANLIKASFLAEKNLNDKGKIMRIPMNPQWTRSILDYYSHSFVYIIRPGK